MQTIVWAQLVLLAIGMVVSRPFQWIMEERSIFSTKMLIYIITSKCITVGFLYNFIRLTTIPHVRKFSFNDAILFTPIWCIPTNIPTNSLVPENSLWFFKILLVLSPPGCVNYYVSKSLGIVPSLWYMPQLIAFKFSFILLSIFKDYFLKILSYNMQYLHDSKATSI